MSKQEAEKNSISFEFEDNLALINLFGQYDENLLLIEKMNDVSISRIGNKVKIKGDKKSIIDTHQILNNLYHKIKNGEEIYRYNRLHPEEDDKMPYIYECLEKHELIKVKFSSVDKNDFKDIILKKTNSFIIGSIGKILILYRPSDGKKIKIPWTWK